MESFLRNFQNLPKMCKLAYRNLYRNKRRTLFAIFIAAAGCASMCIAIGYYAFSIYSLQEMTIRNGFSGSGGSSHVQLTDSRAKNIQEQQSLKYGLSDAEEIVNQIKKNRDVDYVMPRISFGGLISNGQTAFPFIGYGISASSEAKLRNGLLEIDPTLKLGNEIKLLEKKTQGIVLGGSLAKSLDAKVGDMLLLYSTTTGGAVNAIDVQLLAIMSTGISETDKYYLLTRLDVVQKLIVTDKVSNISVMFKNRNQLDYKVQTLRKQLSEHFPKLLITATDWTSYGEFYRSIRDIFNIIFTFMGTIIIVIVLLSCWNIMNMSTMERIREIGTLRAIGLSINNIGSIFLLESFFIGIIGVVIGLIAQYIIAVAINSFQILMPPIPGMNQGYTLQVYNFTPYQPLIALVMIVVITISSLSSFFVIRRYTIVESLEHN